MEISTELNIISSIGLALIFVLLGIYVFEMPKEFSYPLFVLLYFITIRKNKL